MSGDVIVCEADGCGEASSMLHHVTGADGVTVTHEHCAAHHNACLTALHAVPVDDPTRYRMEWGRPSGHIDGGTVATE